jgi:hypothetical protein
MRLTDHVTLNLNNSMSTAAVFLDIEKAFDTTLHNGLLYKLSKMNFSARLIKLISSFLSNRKFSVSVEGEMSTPRIIIALFADDTRLYATDRKEGYVLRKLQRGLNSMVEWSKRWNISINDNKTQSLYFSHRIRQPESLLTINGQNIPL